MAEVDYEELTQGGLGHDRLLEHAGVLYLRAGTSRVTRRRQAEAGRRSPLLQQSCERDAQDEGDAQRSSRPVGIGVSGANRTLQSVEPTVLALPELDGEDLFGLLTLAQIGVDSKRRDHWRPARGSASTLGRRGCARLPAVLTWDRRRSTAPSGSPVERVRVEQRFTGDGAVPAASSATVRSMFDPREYSHR